MDIPPVIQTTAYVPPPYRVNDNKKITKIFKYLFLILILAMIIIPATLGIIELRKARIAKDKAIAKEKVLMLIMDNMKTQYPGLIFSRYSNLVTFNADIKKCKVVSIAFTRNEYKIDIVTVLQGISKEPQDPDVYLTFYDEKGNPIIRQHCVDYYSSILGLGDIRDTGDIVSMDIKQSIAFISIDAIENVNIVNGKLIQYIPPPVYPKYTFTTSPHEEDWGYQPGSTSDTMDRAITRIIEVYKSDKSIPTITIRWTWDDNYHAYVEYDTTNYTLTGSPDGNSKMVLRNRIPR